MRARALSFVTLIAATAAGADAQRTVAPPPSTGPIVREEFVFTKAPTPSVHASTIAATKSGLVVAWFGGRVEGANDVGIWVSRYRRGAWTSPARVVSCTEGRRRNPCWNPVLFETAPGQLTLYYKAGPNPREWWGLSRTSADDGATWTAAKKLPAGILGPIKNKPVRVGDVIVSPSSTESTDNPSRWRVHFERSGDNGRTWSVVSPPADSALDAIQPTVFTRVGNWLEALVRTQAGKVYAYWSDDAGRTWSAPSATPLPNPNAGIDGVTLSDRRLLLVYNHAASGRTPLNAAVSANGVTWGTPVALESTAGEYSYPAVIQTADSVVHVTYTWKRTRIKHVVLDPRRLALPHDYALDSVIATLTSKLAPLAASRDSLAIVLARDSGTVRADSAVMHFREAGGDLLKTIVQSFDDSAFQRAIFPADSVTRRRLRDPSTPFVPPDFAVRDSVRRFLESRGVATFRDEGATYYTLGEAAMLRTFGRYTRESMRAYLRLEAVEQERPSVEDATFRISLDDLGARLATADSVASQFRNAVAFAQIDWRRAAYLYLLLNGTESSPAFSSGGELRASVRQTLERMADRLGATSSGRVVREYLTLLRASGFKDSPAVAELRQRVREAAGPRG